MPDSPPNRIDELLRWYETLRPDTLGQLVRLYTPDAHFRDPFNDVRGHAAIQRIFEHMFEATGQPHFTIASRMDDGRTGFATWRFHFTLRGSHYEVEGASHFRFADDGRVSEHRDYWDAAEELFQKLPVVGGPVRWLRGKFATPGLPAQ